jgi:hypothetical protein
VDDVLSPEYVLHSSWTAEAAANTCSAIDSYTFEELTQTAGSLPPIKVIKVMTMDHSAAAKAVAQETAFSGCA